MAEVENEGSETSPASKYPNLKPAKPGEVRNKNGRPKGSLNTKTVLMKYLGIRENTKNPITGKEQKMSQLEIMVLAQIKQAREGNTQAFAALLDRVDGKPEQQLSHKVAEGTVFSLTVGQPDVMRKFREEQAKLEADNDAGV